VVETALVDGTNLDVAELNHAALRMNHEVVLFPKARRLAVKKTNQNFRIS
jgi:hypothetical protein